MFIGGGTRGLVSLNNLVRVSEEKGPNQIDRLDRERQVAVIANLDQELPIGDAVKAMAPKLRPRNSRPDTPPSTSAARRSWQRRGRTS